MIRIEWIYRAFPIELCVYYAQSYIMTKRRKGLLIVGQEVLDVLFRKPKNVAAEKTAGASMKVKLTNAILA